VGNIEPPLRILITGGFGFLGGRLAVHLEKLGHNIVLGSRNHISPPDWLKRVDVRVMRWNCDESIERACVGVDVIVHAAGINAMDCSIDPSAAFEFNGLQTARLANFSIKAKVKKILYLSSAHVYANPLIGEIDEDTKPNNRHPYAASHLAGENALLAANDQGDIQCVVMRLANIFGAPTHKGVNCWMLLVNDICKQAVQGQKIQLHTSGTQKRDFLSANEFCNVTESLLLTKRDATGVFNIGSGVSRSILEMANLVRERCGEILGFTPDLYVPSSTLQANEVDLIYKSKKLSEIGIEPKSYIDIAEIDSLLEFCNEAY